MKKSLLALALLFAVLLSGCAIVQTTDLADYGNTGGETWHGSAVFDLLSNLTSTGEADGTQSATPPRMGRSSSRSSRPMHCCSVRRTGITTTSIAIRSCRTSCSRACPAAIPPRTIRRRSIASRRSAQPMTRRSSACPPISGCSTIRTTPNMSCWRNPRGRSTTLPARRTSWLPLPCPRAGIPASRSGPSASRRPRERRMHHDLPAVRHRECR